MPGRPSYLPTDVFQRASAARFADRADRDTWALGFNHQASTDIDDLASLIEIPDPAPTLNQFSSPEAPTFSPSQSAAPQDPLPIVTTGMPTIAPPPARVPLNEAPVPTPSGTPAGMPTAPRQTPATITSGPRPGQQLQPGESVGSVTLEKGEIDNSSRQAFVRTAYPYALEAAGGNKVLAEQMLATAISEANAGGGKDLAGVGYNMFGQKARPGEASTSQATWEQGPNGPVNTTDNFRRFNNPTEGFASWTSFLEENPRYHRALAEYRQTGDVDRLWRQVNDAGYATDPAWADKVRSIREQQVAPVTSGMATPAPVAQQRSGPMPEDAPNGGRQTQGSFDPNTITQAYKDVPYVYGGAGGRTDQRLGAATDCSGFVASVWKNQYGVDLPAHTDASYNQLRGLGASEVNQAEARPGDVVYYMGAGTGGAITHHMGIYAGNGKVLDMSTSQGGGVKPRDVGHAGNFVILRDPRVNPEPPKMALEPQPIVESGIAEQTGGKRLSQQELYALTSNTGAASSPAEPVAQASPGPPAGAGPDTLWSPDGPVEQGGAYQAGTGRSGGSGVMMRGPLGAAPAEVGNDEYIDPDQGPREATPGSVGASPVQPYGPPLSEAGPEPEYVPTLADGRTEPPTQTGTYLPTQTIPNPQRPPATDPGQWLAEDSQSTPVQSVADLNQSRRIAPPEVRQGPEVPPPAYTPRGTPEAPMADRPSFDPLTELEQYGEPGRKLATELRRASRDPNHPIDPWAVYEAIQAIPFEIVSRARRELIPDKEAVRAAGTDPVAPFREAATAIGLPLPSPEELNPQGRPASDIGIAAGLTAIAPDPFDPAANAALGAAGRVVGAGARGVRAAGRAVGEAVEPIIEGAGRRVGEALDANAERVAAADARMAAQGSTIAPSTFGVITGNDPMNAMRGHVVPPDVADTLDFPVRVPEDPSVIRAIESAGGRVDPERGVDLYVTRAQGPDAAGGVATRGGVFYEAIPEGGKSAYARGSDDPNNVGGSTVIPRTPTRFRSPLILDDAPGGRQGFDDAMEQMGVTTESRAIPSDVDVPFEVKDKSGNVVGTYMDENYAAAQAKQIGGTYDFARPAPTVGPLRSVDVDDAIQEARRAGPEGSPARAEALKEVVRRYGGTPDEIDALLAIRGADASESTWAIKENILAAHARKNGYDGVVTVQPERVPYEDLAAHPAVKAAQDANNAAWREHEAAQDAFHAFRGRPRGLLDPPPSSEEEFRVMNRVSNTRRAVDETQKALRLAEEQAQKELATGKITELVDVREGRNPTPGGIDQTRVDEARRQAGDAFQRLNQAESRFYERYYDDATPDAEKAALRAEKESALEALRAADVEVGKAMHAPPKPQGYTLRDDIPRRAQASTTANATAGVSRAGAGLLTDASNSLGGGVFGAASGAALPAETDEERRQNALRGAGIGMVGGPIAGRMMPAASGAQVRLGFGGRPANQAASAAADPVMTRMARMMDNPKVPTVANARGLAERWAQAMTDDRAGLRTFQEAVSAKLGRPLGAGEMVADLTRRNGSSVAGQRLAEELRPALVKVGDDDDYLAQYLVHSHNVDVAREIGQRTYDDAIKAGKSVTQAGAEANRAANSRQFSGDLTLAETQAQLAAIHQRVSGLPDGATRWQNVQDAAQAVWDTNKKTLERKRDAGIISTDLYNELTTRYPKYVRTDIADYFDKGAGAGAAVGPKRVGLSDIGVQKISAEGTTKERVNPLLSTLDQTYAAESAIAKNEAGKAFEELLRLDPAWQSTFKEVVPSQGVNVGNPATTVPSSYKLRNGEQFLKVWDGGDARTFVVPQEYAALVSPQTGRVLGDSTAANAWRNTMQVYKSLITSKNPAFSYLVSPVRDLGDYAIQEGVQSAGSAQGVKGAAKALGALPGIMADYARAVPDAFAGLTEGVYKGDLAAMMRNGAGMGSRPQHNVKELRQAYEELKRTNGMEIKSMGDLGRVIGNVLTLGAEPIGGRLEQVPRLAAARRAAKRGANDVEQTMRFRDATVDFQRAGEWARVANELVPFFNVAVQSGAQTVRAAKKNPAAAMAAVASVVGGPAVLAEVLNHRDEQTARDYEDVPDYLKKTGIVFMLPGVEGRNERGDRLPNYLYIPVGQYGALVQTAKETVRKVAAGKADSPDLTSASGWAGLSADIGGIFSPIRGDSAASAATSLIPPGLSTAADLAADTDLYRGSKISTDQRDENASALSQASAAGFNAVTGKETRPSQWEHTYRDLGGYAATLATTGSNMLAEAVGQRRPKDEDRPIQSAPVVGGLVNRVIRDTGGQRMEEARAENTRVPASIRPILEEAGLRREEIMGVPSKYKGASLTREEQERWQEVTNSLVTREIQAARRSSEWRAQGADKQQIIRDAVSNARETAAERALRRLNDGEIERRKRREASRKAS